LRDARHGAGSKVITLVAWLLVGVSLTAGDWPTYLHDPQRSAASQDESTLSVSNVGRLTKLWAYHTGQPIAASPSVVGNTVYVGSWTGYEYALDAATGALKWKTFLGITSVCDNPPVQQGVSSAAAIQNGVVYVGGGDGNWYALEAGTGKILWSVPTGDPKTGHYNWASPLIYGGYAYVGVASGGDCPLVRGQLLKVSLSEHRIVDTFDVVSTGQLGGTIWTSPTLDPETNTIYVTTGNPVNPAAPCAEPLAPAIVALDATTLAVEDWWQIPPAQQTADGDWGTTPTLLHDSSGRWMVEALGKNGYAYAFDRADLRAGPVWQQLIAMGGDCPDCGDGSVSSSTFDGTRLYVAGGRTTVDGAVYDGSVRALDPATGRPLWEHGAPGVVLAALAYAHGMVVDGAGPTLEVLNARDGAPLFHYRTGGDIYGAPSVSNGRIFVGSSDGALYVFGLPQGAAARPALVRRPQASAHSHTLSPPRASYDVSAQPALFMASVPETYDVKLRNSGGGVWPARGANAVELRIEILGLGDNATVRSQQSFPLPDDLAAGSSVTLAVTVDAPKTDGKYSVRYELAYKDESVFPQHVDRDVSVVTFSASYTIHGEPSTSGVCQDVTYGVTVTNTGSSTWKASDGTTPALSVHFGKRGGGYPSSFPWITDRWYYVGGDVAPGESETLTVAATAPAVAGTYVLEYEMVQPGLGYSPKYLDHTVTVTAIAPSSSDRFARRE